MSSCLVRKATKLAHIGTDRLPAVFALDGVFDDGITGEKLVEPGQHIQGESDAEEIDHSVDEGSVA